MWSAKSATGTRLNTVRALQSEDYSADSDEEEGKDWDELMEEAKRSDKLRDEAEGQAEGDDRRGAKRAGGGGARGPPAKKRK